MSVLRFFTSIFLFIFIIFLLSSIFKVSSSQVEQAIELTQENLYNATLFIAFIGGILTIFSPCLFPLLTAYSAYTFKEKKELTKNTLIFFLGFVSVFIPFGLSLSVLGQLMRIYNTQLITISGIIIVIFGIMTIFGKGFSFIKKMPTQGNKPLNIYILGMTFTLGWSPCVGPILFSILFLAANSPNILYSVLLLLLFSIGMWIPMFVISYFYDREKLYRNKWIEGKEVKITSKFSTNTTSLLSGVLLIFLGAVYIVFKGTEFLNVNISWAQSYVLQSFLLSSEFLKSIGTYLGIIASLILVMLSVYLYRKAINKKEKHG